MDTEKFMNLFESSSKPENDFEAAKKAMRHILEASDHYYYDVSGDGTVYVRAGTRNGAGFATCSITLQQDGLAVVRVTSGTVPAEHQACGEIGRHGQTLAARLLSRPSNIQDHSRRPQGPGQGRMPEPHRA